MDFGHEMDYDNSEKVDFEYFSFDSFMSNKWLGLDYDRFKSH